MKANHKEAEDLLGYTVLMLKRFMSEDISTFHPSVLDSCIMKLINAKCLMTKGDSDEKN